MWIVEKNRKRARMHNASGLFSFAERREGLGQWRFGTAVATPPHQSKVLGRREEGTGGGEDGRMAAPSPVYSFPQLFRQ